LVLGLARGVEPAARSVAGLALLGLWSAAQLVTAFFPIDAPAAPPTLAGTIHGLAGLSFLAATAAALLLARGFGRDTRWAAFARPPAPSRSPCWPRPSSRCSPGLAEVSDRRTSVRWW
jgi:hypothetical protein